MSVKNRNTVVTDGLVLYFDAGNADSYSGSGTSWVDLSGNNDGTLTNGPTYSSDNGGKIVLDGTDDYVAITDNIGDPQEFTLAGWVRLTQITGTYRRLIDSNVGNFVVVEQNGKITFRIPGGNGNYWAAGPAFTVNTWGYFTCTYDQSYRKTYFNGSYLDQYSEPGVTVNFGTPSIGNASSRQVEGEIATFKIYNRALTADEVLQNYNALKNRFI